jgi:hypothetical protein
MKLTEFAPPAIPRKLENNTTTAHSQEMNSAFPPVPDSLPKKSVVDEADKDGVSSPNHQQKHHHKGYSDLLPPGVSMKPGSNLERVRKKNSSLWAKIINWD